MIKTVVQQWKEEVKKTQTDEYLLQAFPEAPFIILDKIKELEASLEETKTLIKQFRAAIYHIAITRNNDSLDSKVFFCWFWGKAYIQYFCYPDYKYIKMRIIKLKRQYKNMLPKDKNLSESKDFSLLIQEAKQSPIEDSIELLKPRHTGNRIMAQCPLHEERTGSFVIYLNTNTWHCFGACGTGGDAIDLIMSIKKLSFKEAVIYLT
jgi:hypothetical protein